MGIVECMNHNLVEPFNVLYEKDGSLINSSITKELLVVTILYHIYDPLPYRFSLSRGVCSPVQVHCADDEQWPAENNGRAR